jgi:hypothetical protein
MVGLARIDILREFEKKFPGYQAAVDSLSAGDKLVVTDYLYTPAYEYPAGTVLELIEPTIEAPHGSIWPPHNWVVKCPHQTSVWSNIFVAVAQGILKKDG